ncbi:MAG: PEP-CTERM sorting domain-containing protein [Verrucomicrobia bacterium]|nr:PEP-CTERM sorting domain-containing protein [Verrucomicrobiota bacterium]
MKRSFLLQTFAVLAASICLSVSSANAAVVYSTTFADLSGWSTFSTTAGVKLDAATDNRSVYYNTNSTANGASSIIQRNITLTNVNDTPTISWTLRRDNYSTGTFRLNLFQALGNTHAAGDVQNVDLYLRSYDGNVQFNVSRFNNAIDGTVSTTTPSNTPLVGGKLPPTTNAVTTPVVADYITFTLTMNTAGTWTLTDSRQVNDGFTLSLGTLGGAFETMRLDLNAGNASGQSFLVDSISVSAVPEPATWALLLLSMTTVIVLRRRRNIQNS